MYDLHDDNYPLYFDNIHELLEVCPLRIKDLVYRFNRSNDDFIYIRLNGEIKKLYYVEGVRI